MFDIEFQPFLQSKVDVDPIHSILMFLPCFMHVLCKTRCFQVDCLRIFVFFIHRIHKQTEYCLSFAQIVTSRYQSWIHDGMKIDCLLFSRVQPLHRLLGVDFHDEEDESVSSTLDNRRANIFVCSVSVQILSSIGIVLVDELAESRLCGFALAFDRLAK